MATCRSHIYPMDIVESTERGMQEVQLHRWLELFFRRWRMRETRADRDLDLLHFYKSTIITYKKN